MCAVPHDGDLRVAYDVIVESRTDSEVLVWSDEPQLRGDELTLELEPAAAPEGIPARVVECEPVVVDGTLRYRVRFAVGNSVNSGIGS